MKLGACFFYKDFDQRTAASWLLPFVAFGCAQTVTMCCSANATKTASANPMHPAPMRSAWSNFGATVFGIRSGDVEDDVPAQQGTPRANKIQPGLVHPALGP
eukprot:CAMPEP_0174307830 /NCGR_PEP_ID=MMETSP0810-20121108/1366_1 /TAXON_ID=73025 ORGANISM="Eutreptiella gymnastica-like, Strain CCMP1594" /NCGR_SAMPLE_ID=MMETSP0810 /ASSEMBLY_ACC=CAM_ASM_000659 /LENGTH=101 /DNA_ID=CAMNT_0015414983 /DNA_START=872 /DNA_END=1177 /DNA_ORIENTATION=+